MNILESSYTVKYICWEFLQIGVTAAISISVAAVMLLRKWGGQKH